MKRNWWKWLGVILIAYTVVGGLLMPLKTGITGVHVNHSDSFNLVSGRPAILEIDVYNAADNFTADEVVIQRENTLFRGSDLKWDASGIITCTVVPAFGRGPAYPGMYNLFVRSGKHWMSFPTAVGLNKGDSDTGVSTAAALQRGSLLSDPDKLKGFPNRIILYESIRNLLYHVPMWFSMIFVLAFSAWYAIKFLTKGRLDDDFRSDSLVRAGILAGILGCATGSVWASTTWNAWWPNDPKLNGVAIGMLMYLAYMLLRSGIRDEYQKARVSAVYNLFVFPVFIALIIIMPKLAADSQHPGAGGTVTFKQYDLDSTLRMFFYPAIIGWICILSWIASLIYRYKKLQYQISENE